MFSKVVNYDNIPKKQGFILSISENCILRKTTEEWGGEGSNWDLDIFTFNTFIAKKLPTLVENSRIDPSRNSVGRSILICRKLLKIHDNIEDKLLIRSVCPLTCLHFYPHSRVI